MTFDQAEIEAIADAVAERLVPRSQAETHRPVVTRDQLAKLLQCSNDTIDRWRKSGRIPSIGTDGTRRYIVADVLEALADNAVDATT
ncbi:MAG: helix-turn-helix domain-containing protein [Planctomycetota bacterium]